MEYPQTPYETPRNVPSSPEAAGSTPTTGYEYGSSAVGHESLSNDIERVQSFRVESNVAPVLPAPVAVTPPVSQPQAVDDGAATIPVVANDDDLIEKEWVDKAKSIIVATRDDPYQREQEVKKLQIEYVRKRYGREIGGDNGND